MPPNTITSSFFNTPTAEPPPSQGSQTLSLSASVDELLAYVNEGNIGMATRKKKASKTDCKRSVADTYKVPLLGGVGKHEDFIESEVLLGVEVEVENWCGNDVTGWTSKEDHSLRNKGREFIAGPINVGQLQPRLASLLEAAAKGKWVANARTGIHVHMNVSNKPLDFLLSFVSCYLAAERTLFRYAGEWRRWCNFCHPLDEAEEPLLLLREILLEGEVPPDMVKTLGKYAGLNFTSLLQYGTVEVRILPTTFEYKQIVAWINVLLSIYQTAEYLYETQQSVSDYIKGYGSEAFMRLLFFRHRISLEEFSEVADQKDIRAALPRIKWLQTLSSVVWTDEDKLEYLFKEVPNQEAKAHPLLYITNNPEKPKDFHKVQQALTEALLSGDFSVGLLASNTLVTNPKQQAERLRHNHPKFAAAILPLFGL